MPPPPAVVQARVVARAVTAGLAALAAERPGQPACTVRISAPGVAAADVPLQPGAGEPALLRLRFLSRPALVHTLLSGATRPVLPFGGPRSWRAIPALSALGRELTALTHPDDGLAEVGPRRELAVRLLLGHILPAGLLALAESGAAASLEAIGPFRFAFGVRASRAAGWLSHQPTLDATNGRWTAGTGWPSRRPSAGLAFANSEVAAQALSQRLDELAAVAAGEIVVSGRVPLADTVGHLLNTVGACLRPR